MCDFCDFQENLIDGSMDCNGSSDPMTVLRIEELRSANGGVEYRLCVYFNGHHAYSVPIGYYPVCGHTF